MSPDFKKILLEKKKNLIAEALKSKDECLVLDRETLKDESDLATFQELQHFKLKMKDREKLLIKKIDKALSRLEQGIYFECEKCGNDISEKRLEVRPETTLCIACKEDQERFEKYL